MLQTEHRLTVGSARDLSALSDRSIDLIVTSPPYPMIEMWDDSFAAQDESGVIARALAAGTGPEAFEAMHRILDEVWRECLRVLKEGAFACINIGDATRTLGGGFRLYPNHARLVSAFLQLGFRSLPAVLWRKQTNGPTKFMGSGMLPAGAYVTLEHEYILIFRKGEKRRFVEADKRRRRESAFFWEERNAWFSDIWDLKGVRQEQARSPGPLFDGAVPAAEAGRTRSAAFPFEIPYRLISMYSLRGEVVLDPFLGTGTTCAAALAAGRSSIGYEVDRDMAEAGRRLIAELAPQMNRRTRRRFNEHLAFIRDYEERKGKRPKHHNDYYGFPVLTGQEKELRIPYVEEIVFDREKITAFYRENGKIEDDRPARLCRKSAEGGTRPQGEEQ
jgi:modification methylase